MLKIMLMDQSWKNAGRNVCKSHTVQRFLSVFLFVPLGCEPFSYKSWFLSVFLFVPLGCEPFSYKCFCSVAVEHALLQLRSLFLVTSRIAQSQRSSRKAQLIPWTTDLIIVYSTTEQEVRMCSNN
ncbi:hypothetical protein SSX86_025248 [Deinandra increscens subsp. villosa]|uniref:Uncharacterized protein n=1 Tax=Deinandra increscens subsp. villosa TaxID=3103831 RepID=A0AAP0CDW1_9ASTR